jgi:hypothetical protein
MIPPPILWKAPVVMAVFRGLFMVVYLENLLSLEQFDRQAVQKSVSSTPLSTSWKRGRKNADQAVVAFP